jgi:type II secretory pathway predicted ATPase ExeA
MLAMVGPLGSRKMLILRRMLGWRVAAKSEPLVPVALAAAMAALAMSTVLLALELLRSSVAMVAISKAVAAAALAAVAAAQRGHLAMVPVGGLAAAQLERQAALVMVETPPPILQM